MIDRRMIRVVSDPVRLGVLNFLNERSAAVSEVAAELDISVVVAGGHLEALRDEGMIEVVGEVLNRGAVEPRYKALVRTLFGEEELTAFSHDEQKRLTGWILDMIDSDAREALAGGTFTGRPDAHASRTVPTVDERGWQELRRLFDDTMQAVFAVEAASAERLAESGEASFPVLAALLCTELPPRERRSPGPRQPPG